MHDSTLHVNGVYMLYHIGQAICKEFPKSGTNEVYLTLSYLNLACCVAIQFVKLLLVSNILYPSVKSLIHLSSNSSLLPACILDFASPHQTTPSLSSSLFLLLH